MKARAKIIRDFTMHGILIKSGTQVKIKLESEIEDDIINAKQPEL